MISTWERKPWRTAVTMWVHVEEEGRSVRPTKSPFGWPHRWASINTEKCPPSQSRGSKRAHKHRRHPLSHLESVWSTNLDKAQKVEEITVKNPNLSHKDKVFVTDQRKEIFQNGKKKSDYTVTSDGGHEATVQGNATFPVLQDPWQAGAASSLWDQKQITKTSQRLSDSNPPHSQEGLYPGTSPVVSGCRSTMWPFLKKAMLPRPLNKKSNLQTSVKLPIKGGF